MAMAKCTCVGCPSVNYKILAHLYQQEAWRENRKYIPCEDEECELNCHFEITQEDMLCDKCRIQGGVSRHNVGEIRDILSGKGLLRTDGEWPK